MDSAKVQHVNKASSDELLRKFAELGSESGNEASEKRELQVSKRRKRCRTNHNGENNEIPSKSSSVLVERESLLPTAIRGSVFLRQLGIGRSQLRGRDIKNKSILRTIEKSWRKTVEGASKIFVEKHYNRHKRLINDIV
ncbi:hypothetical protein HHK36_017441 [Tetracentron sinense]|uniref:Uncharacterized protein n=1 Tax=Tetracentron sinense TaxID=13715 RepID=A0A834Z856_TETSI|nr:hypothetical protein HHK36_017441 [Tetracentron sinense]